MTAELHAEIQLQLRTIMLDCAVRARAGETVALLGPSGSGKSTLLRCIAGLVRPERGEIQLGEQSWFSRRGRRASVDLPPQRRAVGMVFQDYALFPHLSVRDNVRFAVPRRADATAPSAEQLLERMGLGALGDARPIALSGGERQRVALARALARGPELLLLDEPLSALDSHTRGRVRAQLGELLQHAGLPALLVTHDVRDVEALADRVVVLDRGQVAQSGTLAELRAAPQTDLVATLVAA